MVLKDMEIIESAYSSILTYEEKKSMYSAVRNKIDDSPCYTNKELFEYAKFYSQLQNDGNYVLSYRRIVYDDYASASIILNDKAPIIINFLSKTYISEDIFKVEIYDESAKLTWFQKKKDLFDKHKKDRFKIKDTVEITDKYDYLLYIPRLIRAFVNGHIWCDEIKIGQKSNSKPW